MSKILTFKGKSTSFNETAFQLDTDDTLHFGTNIDKHLEPEQPVVTKFKLNSQRFIADWNNQELADIFRVKGLLNAAGVICDIDRGITDEGEPWCIFCDGFGDVFIHFCRIDGQYVLDSPSVDKPLRGYDFNALVADFTNRAVPRTSEQDPNVVERRVVRINPSDKVRLHPSALLAALIWTLFLASEELVLITEAQEDADPEQDRAADPSAFVEKSVSSHSVDDIDTYDAPDGAPSIATKSDLGHLLDGLYDGDGTKQIDLYAKEQQTLQINSFVNNAYISGLTAIAIASGLMTERVWEDNREQLLTLLDQYGLNSISSKLSDVQTNEDPSDSDRDFLDQLLDISLFDGIKDDLVLLFDSALSDLSDTDIQLSEVNHFSTPILSKARTEYRVVEEDFTGEGRALGERIAAYISENQDSKELVAADQDSIAVQTDHIKKSIADKFDDTDFLKDMFLEISGSLQATSINDIAIYTTLDMSASDADLEEKIYEVVLSANTSSYEALPESNDVSDNVSQNQKNDEKFGTRLELNQKTQSYFDTLFKKIQSVEMVFVKEELILVDRSALDVEAHDRFSIHWELDDGRVIATIGLRADLEVFDFVV